MQRPKYFAGFPALHFSAVSFLTSRFLPTLNVLLHLSSLALLLNSLNIIEKTFKKMADEERERVSFFSIFFKGTRRKVEVS